MRIKRDAAVSQLKHQTESMKLLERDIYEINRKLDIVNTENCRFKVVSMWKINSAHSQSEVTCSFLVSEGASHGNAGTQTPHHRAAFVY